MYTESTSPKRLTDGHHIGGGAAARLAVRRRCWIRLADEPMNSAPDPIPFQYRYGMFGEATQTVGTLASDFQYAGMYYHAPSGLNLTTYRPYSPVLGRFISRDPIGGTNLYAYCGNNPISNRDPLGLDWNSFNFFGHYMDQSGTAVDLGQIGLGSAFESSPSVSQEVSNFNGILSGRAIAIAQENCKKPHCGDQTVNANLNAQSQTYVGNNDFSQPLFSVGHSTFYVNSGCHFTFNCQTHQLGYSCDTKYSIRDKYRDLGGNGTSYGGKPYAINYSFSGTLGGSGEF